MEYFFHSALDADQKKALEEIRSQFSVEEVLQALETCKGQKVLVVGEPIVDTYIFCDAMGISSKSPTVSVRRKNEENYAGGSLAIANHLVNLGIETSLLITHGSEPYFKDLLTKTLHPLVKLITHETPGIPTPRKTRFLVPFQLQKIFELVEIDEGQWKRENPERFIQTFLKASNASDITIIADFGHGLFEGPVLKIIPTLKPFVALNVQTNSANYGFNPFTKHKRFDYLSIDERETRLASHDRFSEIETLARETVHNRTLKSTSVTLGVRGSLYFDSQMKEWHCPVWFKDVVDTTGSGDAYFAVTSLLVKAGANPMLIPFLGNCYAGLHARIVGNKQSATLKDLQSFVEFLWTR